MLRRYGRHHALSEPRIEMAPLLDVIFLLLTFFIYSIVLTVRAQVMPVTLPELTTGEMAADVKIAAVSVDKQGRFFLNQQEMTQRQLEERLSVLAGQDDPPVFYLAIDAEQGEVDRAPLLIDMIEMFRRLKIDSLTILGRGSGK